MPIPCPSQNDKGICVAKVVCLYPVKKNVGILSLCNFKGWQNEDTIFWQGTHQFEEHSV